MGRGAIGGDIVWRSYGLYRQNLAKSRPHVKPYVKVEPAINGASEGQCQSSTRPSDTKIPLLRLSRQEIQGCRHSPLIANIILLLDEFGSEFINTLSHALPLDFLGH